MSYIEIYEEICDKMKKHAIDKPSKYVSRSNRIVKYSHSDSICMLYSELNWRRDYIIASISSSTTVTFTYIGEIVPAIGYNNPPSYYQIADTVGEDELYVYSRDFLSIALELIQSEDYTLGKFIKGLSLRNNSEQKIKDFGRSITRQHYAVKREPTKISVGLLCKKKRAEALAKDIAELNIKV